MGFLCICLICAQLFIGWELRNLRITLAHQTFKKQEQHPPKARGSFVIKRMEERLKEALYE